MQSGETTPIYHHAPKKLETRDHLAQHAPSVWPAPQLVPDGLLSRAAEAAISAAGAGDVGLSSSHIPPLGSDVSIEPVSMADKAHALEVHRVSLCPLPPNKQVTLSLAKNGNYVELRGCRPGYDQTSSREHRRGAVRTFSAGSRKRLLRTCASIDRERMALPLFATLTYPREWSPDYQAWKRDLEALAKRILRRCKTASIIWRLEFQKRGAPHYHLLIFGMKYLDHNWLAQAWYEVVGSGDPNHRAAGTEVRRVKDWRGVMAYASKYLSKIHKGADVPAPENVGRWWGVINRKALPVEWRKIVLTWQQFHKYRRILHRHRIATMPPDKPPRASTGLLTGISAFMLSDAAERLIVQLGDHDTGVPDALDSLAERAESHKALWLLAYCRVEVSRLRLGRVLAT